MIEREPTPAAKQVLVQLRNQLRMSKQGPPAEERPPLNGSGWEDNTPTEPSPRRTPQTTLVITNENAACPVPVAKWKIATKPGTLGPALGTQWGENRALPVDRNSEEYAKTYVTCVSPPRQQYVDEVERRQMTTTDYRVLKN